MQQLLEENDSLNIQLVNVEYVLYKTITCDSIDG